VKIATVVELDIKEIQAALIAKAKENVKTDPGGHSIHFTIEEGNVKRVLIRFGNRLTDEEGQSQPVEDQEEPQSSFREG